MPMTNGRTDRQSAALQLIDTKLQGLPVRTGASARVLKDRHRRQRRHRTARASCRVAGKSSSSRNCPAEQTLTAADRGWSLRSLAKVKLQRGASPFQARPDHVGCRPRAGLELATMWAMSGEDRARLQPVRSPTGGRARNIGSARGRAGGEDPVSPAGVKTSTRWRGSASVVTMPEAVRSLPCRIRLVLLVACRRARPSRRSGRG